MSHGTRTIKLKDCFFHIFFIGEEIALLSLIDVMKEVVACSLIMKENFLLMEFPLSFHVIIIRICLLVLLDLLNNLLVFAKLYQRENCVVVPLQSLISL